MGFAENAIDSNSYKPGDIIKSLKGLTVEIGNTDAEGRLVLADALTYTCQKYQPETIIDIATLTGSIMVGLGEETGGIFSNDDGLVEALMKSSENSGEEMWRMPIKKEHREGIKREAADLNNCGKSRYGDASSAAAFLERFLEKPKDLKEGETRPKWAHLDIAGPAHSNSKGCTGFGAHLLLDFIKNN